MTLIERLKTMMAAREQRAIATFEELAAELARGTEPPIERVQKILAESGRSVDDLAQVVEREKAKSQARQQIAEGERAAIALQQVEGEISKHDRALSEAREKHGKAVTPLIARRDQLKATVSTGQQARQRLLQSPPAEVAQELGDIGRATLAAQNRLAVISEAMHSARTDLDKLLRQSETRELTRTVEAAEASQQRISAARQKVENLQRQADDLQAEMTELVKQREQAEARTLALAGS